MEKKANLKMFFIILEKIGRLMGSYFIQPHEYDNIPSKPHTILRTAFKGPMTLHWGIDYEGSIPFIFIHLGFGYGSQKEPHAAIDISFGYREGGLGWTIHCVGLEECPEKEKAAVNEMISAYPKGINSDDDAFKLIKKIATSFAKAKR